MALTRKPPTRPSPSFPPVFRSATRTGTPGAPGKLFDLNKATARNGYPLKIDPQMAQSRDAGPQSGAPVAAACSIRPLARLVALWGFHSATTSRLALLPMPQKNCGAGQGPPSHGRSGHRTEALAIPRNRGDATGFWRRLPKAPPLTGPLACSNDMAFNNAIINAGGDLNVLGSHGARQWHMGIRHPKHWGVIASVQSSTGRSALHVGQLFSLQGP